jgi:cysteine desulfuration protein SufE
MPLAANTQFARRTQALEQQAESAANRLDRIVAEFTELEPRERLELLLEFADGLPPVPAEYQADREKSVRRVHECQTPVYLWVRVNDGRVEIHAQVPEETPTVRGFLGILVRAFSGALPEEVLGVKPHLLARLGLVEALGMVRMRGLSAIVDRIKTEVRKSIGPMAVWEATSG